MPIDPPSRVRIIGCDRHEKFTLQYLSQWSSRSHGLCCLQVSQAKKDKHRKRQQVKAKKKKLHGNGR